MALSQPRLGFTSTIRREARNFAQPPPGQIRRAPAFTYALALCAPGVGSRPPVQLGYKIGWAFDWDARMRTFNHVAMPALGGLTYAAGMKHLWPSAMAAYRMEQAVLRRFDKARHAHNHEIVTNIEKGALELVWASCMSEVKRRL